MSDNLAVRKDRDLYPHFLLGKFLGMARLADYLSHDRLVAGLQEIAADYDDWLREGKTSHE